MGLILNIQDFGKSMDEVRKVYPNATYLGRTMRGLDLVGGPLANNVGQGLGRAAAISAFRSWVWGKIQEKDAVVLNALRAIGPDSVLVCWCSPQPCHSATVLKAAAWIKEKGL